MSAVLSHLHEVLDRDGARLAEFCRVTGFPMSTIQSMRLADSPKHSTTARLWVAIATWKKARRNAERNRSNRSSSHDYFPDYWKKAAASASDAYMRALAGRRFENAKPSALIIDLAGPRHATSREPCARCGVRGDVGCSHQMPLAGAR